MPRPLILVAAGGLARETAEAVRAQGQFDVFGAIDDNHETWGRAHRDFKVLGGLDLVADHPDAAVVVCAGKGATRAKLVERLTDLGVAGDRFATVIHPSVALAPTCTVGPGSIVLAGCVFTADVELGRHVVLMPRVVLTHDDLVADYATLCAGVVLGGSVQIGRAAYIGMAASIRENRSVGANATIGMGAVVLTDVPSEQTWIGCPARPIAVDGGRS